jgi:hypothetical protein
MSACWRSYNALSPGFRDLADIWRASSASCGIGQRRSQSAPSECQYVLDGLRVGPVFRGETEWAALCELKPA